LEIKPSGEVGEITMATEDDLDEEELLYNRKISDLRDLRETKISQLDLMREMQTSQTDHSDEHI
jgi:hypothetical protein